MTSTGISKSIIVSAMLKDVDERFGRDGCIDRINSFDKICFIAKDGSLIDFDTIDRIYVEY